ERYEPRPPTGQYRRYGTGGGGLRRGHGGVGVRARRGLAARARERGRVPTPRRGAHPDLDEPVLTPVRRVSAPVLRVAAKPTAVLASSDPGGSRHHAARYRLPPVHVSGPLKGAEGGGILARLRHRPPARPGAAEPPDVVEGRAAAGDATLGNGEARLADLLARDRAGRHQIPNVSM